MKIKLVFNDILQDLQSLLCCPLSLWIILEFCIGIILIRYYNNYIPIVLNLIKKVVDHEKLKL